MKLSKIMSPNLMRSGSASIARRLPQVFAGLAMAASCAFASTGFAAEPAVGNAEAAKAKVSMCIGCHGISGYRASFPEVYSVPMIAGQNAAYLQVALRAYASGERTHPTMDAIAKSLSDQDIADLSAYYAKLK
jgi:cytochrome c553